MRMGVFLLIFSTVANAYEGPAPLKNISVQAKTTHGANGLYSYRYKISNPLPNDGEIREIGIIISRNPLVDSETSSNGLTFCAHHSVNAAAMNLANTPMVPVGAASPDGWSCDYMPDGHFSFGSFMPTDRVIPGHSSPELTITSFAPPGIRDIDVEPVIDLDQLPESYNENDQKLSDLEDKVRWTGKTIGPKAPPKNFIPANYLDYLISLKNQSVDLGWIPSPKLQGEIEKTLKKAKTHLAPCDQPKLRGELRELVERMIEYDRRLNREDHEHAKKSEKEKREQHAEKPFITAEAIALLKFNTEYFLNQLKKPDKSQLMACDRDNDGDRDKKEE